MEGPQNGVADAVCCFDRRRASWQPHVLEVPVHADPKLTHRKGEGSSLGSDAGHLQVERKPCTRVALDTEEGPTLATLARARRSGVV